MGSKVVCCTFAGESLGTRLVVMIITMFNAPYNIHILHCTGWYQSTLYSQCIWPHRCSGPTTESLGWRPSDGQGTSTYMYIWSCSVVCEFRTLVVCGESWLTTVLKAGHQVAYLYCLCAVHVDWVWVSFHTATKLASVLYTCISCVCGSWWLSSPMTLINYGCRASKVCTYVR